MAVRGQQMRRHTAASGLLALKPLPRCGNETPWVPKGPGANDGESFGELCA